MQLHCGYLMSNNIQLIINNKCRLICQLLVCLVFLYSVQLFVASACLLRIYSFSFIPLQLG